MDAVIGDVGGKGLTVANFLKGVNLVGDPDICHDNDDKYFVVRHMSRNLVRVSCTCARNLQFVNK
jgi:hypothetical protein